MQPHGSRFEHEAAWPHLAACRTSARSISCATTDCKLFAANDAKRVAGQRAGTSLSVHVSDPDVEAASVRSPRCCQSVLSEHTGRIAAARLWALHCSTVLEILHGCAPLSWTEQVEARRCYLRASTSGRYPCTGSAQPAQVVDRAPAQGRPRGGHQRTAGAYKRARQAMGKGEALTS